MIKVESNKRKEKTISIGKANIYGILIILPVLLFYFIMYYLLNNNENIVLNLKDLVINSKNKYGAFLFPLMIFVGSIIGIIIHELIHGFCWSLFARKGFESIKFGVVWEMLTPYCHCKEALNVKQYIFGIIMPGILQGFLPCLYAIIVGNIGIFVIGVFFTMAAGGDLLMIFLLRKEEKTSKVMDHPSEVGCYIIDA